MPADPVLSFAENALLVRACCCCVQVKVLFAVAGVMQPSVIFIDEIDSIMSARKADGERPWQPSCALACLTWSDQAGAVFLITSGTRCFKLRLPGPAISQI